jgi:exopolyphosphatase
LVFERGYAIAIPSIDVLNEYLRDTKSALTGGAPVRVILGNKASDLDSMASSIAYAYLLSQARTAITEVVLPVMNIPRSEFKLRTEADYLFREVGIDISNLVFLDEIDLNTLRDANHLKLVLIDHNRLGKSQQGLAENVEEILDHHVDEGLYPNVSRRIIEPVGSSATLITEQIDQQRPDLFDEVLATLLLGTILLDTANLDPSRTNAKDEAWVARLSTLVDTPKDNLFSKVQYEKFNASTLSTPELLRKDYKQWHTGKIKYGISSVPLSIEAWIAKEDNLAESFQNYAQARGLNVLLAMNFYDKPRFSRQLVVYSDNEALNKEIVATFNNADVRLESIEQYVRHTNNARSLLFFKQHNIKMSRKKIQPLLEILFGS